VYCVHEFNNGNILAAIMDTILLAASPEAVVAGINILLGMEKLSLNVIAAFRGRKRKKRQRRT
jgi:hypothetical protein